MTVIRAHPDIADRAVVFFETDRVTVCGGKGVAIQITFPDMPFRLLQIPDRKPGEKRIDFRIAQDGEHCLPVFLRCGQLPQDQALCFENRGIFFKNSG